MSIQCLVYHYILEAESLFPISQVHRLGEEFFPRLDYTQSLTLSGIDGLEDEIWDLELMLK